MIIIYIKFKVDESKLIDRTFYGVENPKNSKKHQRIFQNSKPYMRYFCTFGRNSYIEWWRISKLQTS